MQPMSALASSGPTAALEAAAPAARLRLRQGVLLIDLRGSKHRASRTPRHAGYDQRRPHE